LAELKREHPLLIRLWNTAVRAFRFVSARVLLVDDTSADPRTRKARQAVLSSVAGVSYTQMLWIAMKKKAAYLPG
jgi:hypothetical protein